MPRHARRSALSLALVLLSATFASAQTSLALMPLPAHMEAHTGELILDGSFDVTIEGFTEPRLERARLRFLNHLTLQTGIPFVAAAPGNHAHLVLRAAGPGKPVQELGEPESYSLEIQPDQAVLTAPNPLGLLRGLQTFLQLVHPSANGMIVSDASITDQPRFPWRGLMLDTGRHFMPLPDVLATLDGMEAVKMNVFHWHLSEDQGFRVESKTFPLLQQRGSDGLFYTQEQIRDTIAYARDRGIRIIPEFDMPGHATSWFVGYPQLASAPGPYEIERKWGVFDPAMDPTREETYQFLDRFLGEMTALFPDAFFHVGGDECNGKQWDANPRIRSFMQAHHFAGDAALQAYFTARVQRLVTQHGKQMVGWDEVLQPDTPRDVVIQSWRGPKSLREAATRGYRGLLSAGYYIDLNESAADHYSHDPLGDKLDGGDAPLPPQAEANILGGEATMWSEFMSPEILHNRVWPRTAAIAERLWSPRSVTDVASMYTRLALVRTQLTYLGLNNGMTRRDMLVRMSGSSQIDPLLVLASAVQPPREYAREDLRDYNQFTPLNRLVDAIPAESDLAREFTNLSVRIHDGTATPADHSDARHILQRWQANDIALQPLIANSALTMELAPLSRNLAETASMGLAALDRIEQHTPSSKPLEMQQTTRLKALEAPQAVLLNMAVPGVRLLVETP